MTAIAQEPSAFATKSGVTRDLPKYFYTWMAGLCMIVAFAGFTPSYWAPVATGSFRGAPLFLIHGLFPFGAYSSSRTPPSPRAVESLSDLASRRPHPAYLIGGGIVLATQLLRVPLSTTAAWRAIANGMLALAAI